MKPMPREYQEEEDSTKPGKKNKPLKLIKHISLLTMEVKSDSSGELKWEN
jgi:hypothetical protein